MNRIRNAREYHKALDEMDLIERFNQFNSLPGFLRTKLLALAAAVETFELSRADSAVMCSHDADYVRSK
jgi:hypothetical protein